MNLFKTDELGGHPFTLNHAAFMQNINSEVFRGILSGLARLNTKGYILSGCQIYTDGGTSTLWITEGYAVIKFGLISELFYVPNHDLGVASLADPYWKLVETNIAPSPVNYKTTGAKNVHKQRRLTLDSSSALFYPKYSETPTLIAELSDMLTSSQWYQVGNGGTGEPAYATNWAASAIPVKFKKQLGEGTIIGSLLNPGFTTGTNKLIFTLPAGFRPIQKIVYRGWDVYQGEHSLVEINTNGEVEYSIPGVSVSNDSVGFSFDGWCKFPVV